MQKKLILSPLVAILVFACLLLFSACSEEMSRSFSPPSNAFGKVNQLYVIADKDIWESAVGDTIQYYFSSAFPILPQPEPLFDIKHFTPKDLQEDPLRKELRTYLFVGDLSDPNSPTAQLIKKDIGSVDAVKTKSGKSTNTRVAQDKWAKGQLLIYMFAEGRDELVETIKNNFPAATQRIHQADKEQLWANVFQVGKGNKLEQEIQQTLGIELAIPSDYFVALSDDATMWLRKENEFLSSNIILHKVKYADQSQLTKAGLKAMRDTLGKRYVSSEMDSSYMHTNDVDLPMFVKSFERDDLYIVEARGIWEMVNDFMGGPFISYMMLNRANNELLFADCFVYAPGKKKRRFMQELELIVSTIKIQEKS